MGRRGRQRVKGTMVGPARSSSSNVRMARVRADDETWLTFRTLAGARPISEVLGELVAQEVRRYHSRQLREQALQPSELVEALERAHRQRADLELLVVRLEALARHNPLDARD
jgi:hypothetical protein